MDKKDVGHFPLTKCLYPKYVPRVPGMSLEPHFQIKIYFTIPQSLKGERSFVGAPASLYNLTKNAPDP